MKPSTIASLIISGLILPTHAQVLSPPTGGTPIPDKINPATNATSSDTITRSASSSKSPNGEEIPLIDPTQKTVSFQGRTYSLMAVSYTHLTLPTIYSV